MKKYNTFLGVDVAKYSFVVAIHEKKGKVATYSNDNKGIKAFIREHKQALQNGLVVLESTGGHEWKLLDFLQKNEFAVHRADTLKVKNYIRSIRHYGKTDSIDARALASYAFDRSEKLSLFNLPEKAQLELQQLVRRRDELIKMRVQENNRLTGPMGHLIASSVKPIIKTINRSIEKIEKEIAKILDEDSNYKALRALMLKMPGVGEVTANALLALLPELGFLTRREIAHLAGVAPHPHDSGKYSGYRKIRGGRPEVKKALYMAAMAASNSKSWLGDYYRQLIARGKKGIVALTALMRKMITTLNGRIRDERKKMHELSVSPIQIVRVG